MPPAGKKLAPSGKDDNFRARRLSVSDIDTSEFDKANSTPAKGGGGQRGRRMSMSPEMGVVKPKKELPFPLEMVGTYSCHGVEPGMRQGETSAKINQDRGCVCYPFGEKPEYNQALFCVYDGHGALGDKVSHYTMNKIQEVLEKHPDLEADPMKALRETFVKVDDDLRKDKSIDAELSGTTAVVLVYRQDTASKKVTIWSACCGDSRATIKFTGLKSNNNKLDEKFGKSVDSAAVTGTNNKDEHCCFDLTEDQKPDTPAEMARIKKAGGFVSPPEEEWGGPARVWLDANMTLPGLAMARSIGDHLVSSVGVFADPEVKQFDVGVPPKEGEDGADFIVMASDGVWEFIDSRRACQLVAKFIVQPGGKGDATLAVTKLIETAAAKWRQEEGDYRDDITAICIRIRDLFESAINEGP